MLLRILDFVIAMLEKLFTDSNLIGVYSYILLVLRIFLKWIKE